MARARALCCMCWMRQRIWREQKELFLWLRLLYCACNKGDSNSMQFARILTAPIFSTFLCSLALLLNAFIFFILVEAEKHTHFCKDFQRIEAFGVMVSGVIISAIKILPLLSQFRSPLNSKLCCSASQLCCLFAFQVSKDAITSGYQLPILLSCFHPISL